jgi:hypothetical protein
MCGWCARWRGPWHQPYMLYSSSQHLPSGALCLIDSALCGQELSVQTHITAPAQLPFLPLALTPTWPPARLPACPAAGAPAAALPLNALSEVSLDGYLAVDPASMEALQIFHVESHPSAMGIGKRAGVG